MPQVIKTQPTGAFTQGGAGIGAVIFDKPKYDPQTMALKVQGDLENWAKEKQADAAKEKEKSAALLKDLDFSAEGIYDYDAPHFIEGKDKLIEEQVKLAGLRPNTPEWTQQYYKAKAAKDRYAVEVQASKQHKDMLKRAYENFDPTKHDKDTFDEWVVKMRTAPTIDERIKIAGENPLKEKIGDFQQMLGERMAKGLYKPSVTEKEVTLKSGRIGIENVEEMTDDDIVRNARAIIGGDEDMAAAAEKGLNQLQAGNSFLYDQIITEAKALGIDPLELYARKQLKNSVNKKYQLKGTVWSPFTEAEAKAGAEYKYGNKDTEDAVNFIVEQGANLLNGKPESFTIVGQKVNETAPLPYFGNVTVSVPAPSLSDQFQGWKMGKYVVDEPTSVAGQTKKTSKDNIVLGWMWKDGKPYIKTEETLYSKGQSIAGIPIDNDGWKMANQTDIERLIIANVPANKVTAALEAYRSKLTKEKAYQERTARPQEMTGQTKKAAPKTQDIQIKVEQPMQQQPKQETKKETITW